MHDYVRERNIRMHVCLYALHKVCILRMCVCVCVCVSVCILHTYLDAYLTVYVSIDRVRLYFRNYCAITVALR